jgi:hypothetical protein
MSINKNGPARKPVTEHGVDHAHESRVDEMSEEHATHSQHAAAWVRPTSLDAPPARPGMVQRWVRLRVRGEADPKNLNRAYREGWRFRHPDTLPEDFSALLFATPAQASDGKIVVDDLALMELPEATFKAKQKAIRQATRLQMQGVEHDLEQSQVAGHPILKDHKTSVSYPGRARRVEAADDE